MAKHSSTSSTTSTTTSFTLPSDIKGKKIRQSHTTVSTVVSSDPSFGASFTLARLVFLIILFLAVFRVLSGGQIPTLYSVLNYVSTCPQIDMDFLSKINTNLSITFPDWLAWLGAFIDYIVDTARLAAFTATSLLNCVTIIIWALGFVFVTGV